VGAMAAGVTDAGRAGAAADDGGALGILRRLKAELDPGGVLPPAEAAFGPEG